MAGQYLVGLVRLDDGRHLLVNRGFVPLAPGAVVEDVAAGPTELRGWLRLSVEKGTFGAADTGEGDLVPRLDVDAIGGRLDVPVEPVWLQLAPADEGGLATFPDPIALPPLDGGPHLGYMGQWFIFAVLGAGFYLVLLRRNARSHVSTTVLP